MIASSAAETAGLDSTIVEVELSLPAGFCSPNACRRKRVIQRGNSAEQHTNLRRAWGGSGRMAWSSAGLAQKLGARSF